MTYFCTFLNIVPNIQHNKITDAIKHCKGKIKNELNLSELALSKDIYSNNELHTYNDKINLVPNMDFYSRKETEFFDVYGGRYIVTKDNIDYEITICFYKLKNPELINSQFIKNFIFIFKQAYFISNNILDIDYHEYRLSLFLKKFDETMFYDLSYISNQNCKTPLYRYQRHNIANILKIHKNGIKFKFTTDLLMFFNNNIIYNSNNETFIDKSDIPETQFYGGIVMDEPGTGKTLQFIIYLLETIHELEKDERAVIIVPNIDIKTHWENEFKKHIIIPLKDIPIFVLTAKEFVNYNLSSIKILIVDEIHTLWTDKNKCFDLIKKLDIKYKWGLSATPFINHESLFNIINFLIGQNLSPEHCRVAHNPYIQNKFMNVFFKNTKANTKDEYPWPDIVIHNIKLKFDKIQQNLYDTEAKLKNSVYNLRLIACQIQMMYANMASSLTPKQLKEYITNHYKSLYDNEVEKFNELNKQIININRNIAIFTKNEYLQRFEHYNKLLDQQKTEVEKIKNVLEYHKKVSNNIITLVDGKEIDTDDVCAICLTPHQIPIIYSKMCGHYFCKECIDSMRKMNVFDSSFVCPICRQNVSVEDTIVVNDKCEIVESSKIQYVIQLLKTTENRFIIFTQFPKIIDSLILKLTSSNITVNKFSKYKINRDPTVRIVLLSSEEDAAGIDLSEFCKVIIFEPFDNSTYCKEIEKQLIGRVHRQGQTNTVEIFRLIVTNTIEDEIYSRYI